MLLLSGQANTALAFEVSDAGGRWCSTLKVCRFAIGCLYRHPLNVVHLLQRKRCFGISRPGSGKTNADELSRPWVVSSFHRRETNVLDALILVLYPLRLVSDQSRKGKGIIGRLTALPLHVRLPGGLPTTLREEEESYAAGVTLVL